MRLNNLCQKKHVPVHLTPFLRSHKRNDLSKSWSEYVTVAALENEGIVFLGYLSRKDAEELQITQ